MIRPMLFLTLATALAVPAAAQTQAQMNARAARAYVRADAALNGQYRITMASLKRSDARSGDDEAAVLLRNQRQWIRNRDRHCGAVGRRYAGGSAQGMMVATCKADFTRTRTADLRRMTR